SLPPVCFFFSSRRRHTRSKRDWSSDVCSSDLSSVAYNLLNDGYTGKIIVFEKDQLYEHSSTPRSAGGIRQLFTTAVNIQISRYGLQKYKTFADDIAVAREKAEVQLNQRGCLLLAQNQHLSDLNHQP